MRFTRRLKNYIPQTNKKYGKIFFQVFHLTVNIKNNIFFAIKGNEIDGNNFIKDIKKGSKIIITEKIKPQKESYLYQKTLESY